MRLDGHEFGTVWNSSGAQGFYGEGREYKHHRLWRWLGLDYTGVTFVAKTVTTQPRAGNMRVTRRGGPKHLRPDCIRCKFLRGVVLNAVGLTNSGAKHYLNTNKWQMRTEPFVLSFAPMGVDCSEQVADAHAFADILAAHLFHFRAPVALEVNLSCPNTSDSHSSNRDTVVPILQALRGGGVDVPLIPKFNALEPLETAQVARESGLCGAVAVGNTIPWGREPTRIDWAGLFGPGPSPLAKYGGGGLSGWPLLPLTLEWVKRGRELLGNLPIIAGGGIMSRQDACSVFNAGASAVELGVVAILRPWRIRSIVDTLSLGS